MGLLYDRIVKQGTIDEPNGKPEPLFALPSTVNWMKALAFLCAEEKVSFAEGIKYYKAQGKRDMKERAENTVFEQLFLGLHQLSALESMKKIKPSSDITRVGIIAWYYGISNAASAMIAAKESSFQEDHAGTARMWDSSIASKNLAMKPFNWRVTSLIKNNYKAEIEDLFVNNKGNLLKEPRSRNDANGAVAAYLSGTADWYAWKYSEDIKKSKEFKQLNVSDFRKRAARDLRDKKLSDKSVGFLHQAYRYRGKANYREALFLAYGKDLETKIEGFIQAQADVLSSFLAMAGAFCSRKLGKALWNEFMHDVCKNRAFTIDPESVWSIT